VPWGQGGVQAKVGPGMHNSLFLFPHVQGHFWGKEVRIALQPEILHHPLRYF
jgi:hypothetical protein